MIDFNHQRNLQVIFEPKNRQIFSVKIRQKFSVSIVSKKVRYMPVSSEPIQHLSCAYKEMTCWTSEHHPERLNFLQSRGIEASSALFKTQDKHRKAGNKVVVQAIIFKTCLDAVMFDKLTKSQNWMHQIISCQLLCSISVMSTSPSTT